MSSEHTDEFPQPSRGRPLPEEAHRAGLTSSEAPVDDPARREALAERREASAERREAMAERREAAVERRETTAELQNTKPAGGDEAQRGPSASQTEANKSADADKQAKSPAKDGQTKDAQKPQTKEKPKPTSEAKVKMQSRLPALEDDADIGVEKEQIVTRDGKADLAFTGTLMASAAPLGATKGHWQEYRVYQTNGGKHVFSKVNRTVYLEEHDAYQAEVFDPAPSSTTSQLMRTARDLTRSHPMTWEDAAVGFFGYDPLAKTLYRKLSGRFEEHIE